MEDGCSDGDGSRSSLGGDAEVVPVGVLDTFDLSGKVAVVTGGNRGLGEAWVRSLLDVGATVVIAARDAER
jgi:3-oxoacyl-ACP reductase-like protein